MNTLQVTTTTQLQRHFACTAELQAVDALTGENTVDVDVAVPH